MNVTPPCEQHGTVGGLLLGLRCRDMATAHLHTPIVVLPWAPPPVSVSPLSSSCSPGKLLVESGPSGGDRPSDRIAAAILEPGGFVGHNMAAARPWMDSTAGRITERAVDRSSSQRYEPA